LPFEEIDFLKGLEKEPTLKNLRIGYLSDMKAGLPVNSEVRAAAAAAAQALESAGAHVEEMKSFLTPEMFDGWWRFFEARSGADLAQLPPEKRAQVLPFIADWCTWRSKNFTGADVIRAYASIMLLRESAIAATLPYDYVISPTSPILPYEAELPAPGNDPHNALPHIAFTVPFSMSEQPAASLNWTYSKDGLPGKDGPLPVGIQIIGRRFDDLGVLRLARMLEQMRPAQLPWPSFA
jgi:aspartyl-tRNA(Asn)/glutamyl-tRNA(Gln) amidotransferase subunit A